MAEFMDVHRGMVDITPEALLEAHQADLAIQGEENVDYQARLGGSEVRDGLLPVGGTQRRGRATHPRTRRPSRR
jgi:hypothetical protein